MESIIEENPVNAALSLLASVTVRWSGIEKYAKRLSDNSIFVECPPADGTTIMG
jgi:hypothetical protein